jgi:hypothetical protein
MKALRSSRSLALNWLDMFMEPGETAHVTQKSNSDERQIAAVQLFKRSTPDRKPFECLPRR